MRKILLIAAAEVARVIGAAIHWVRVWYSKR